MKEIEDPLGTAKPTTSKLVIPSINPPAYSVPNLPHQANYPSDTQVTPGSSTSNSATGPSSFNLTPNYLTTASGRIASRESRISLPDEARRYYASLADSPLSSPHAAAAADAWSSSKRQMNGEPSLAQVPEESDSRGDESASPRPFLELDTTDDSESDHRGSGEARNRETDSDLGPEGTEQLAPNADVPGHAINHQSRMRTRKATADQFPLPPTTTYGVDPQSPIRAQSADAFSGPNNGRALTSESLITSTVNSTLTPDLGSKRTREKVDSFIMPTNQPAATFRQMPLLDTDLKTSTVEVLGNHIRANDKGKEVLSFVIAIHVVGKESWQVRGSSTDGACPSCFEHCVLSCFVILDREVLF